MLMRICPAALSSERPYVGVLVQVKGLFRELKVDFKLIELDELGEGCFLQPAPSCSWRPFQEQGSDRASR